MNSFGRNFRVSIYGESHGAGVGVVVDGVFPGIELCVEDFLEDLAKRKAGKIGTTSRIEGDIPEILSGVYNGFTTGAPINIFFRNSNTDSKVYRDFKSHPRPGHADLTSTVKYGGFNDLRGSGHFSGRMTLALVAAGVIGKKLLERLKVLNPLPEAVKNVRRNIEEIDSNKKDIEVSRENEERVDRDSIQYITEIYKIGREEIFKYSSEEREEILQREVESVYKEGDSLGGVIQCTLKNLPIGLGEPFFDSVESYISHLIFSIPGIKGIEFGAGFEGCTMRGSEFNDPFINVAGETATNNNGGINGGISNGNDLVFRVAVKPTSSIFKAQESYNFQERRMETLEVKGRHDAAFILRVPVIVEGAAVIALADLMLQKHIYQMAGYKN